MRFGGEVFVGHARGRVLGALLWAVMILLAGGAAAQAQSDQTRLDGRKFEVGAQLAFFRDSSPKSRELALYPSLFQESSRNNPGFGGRVGYNLSSHFAVEAEVNFLPRENIKESGLILGIADPSAPAPAVTALIPTNTGRKVEALFGLKAGSRIGRLGLFAKARPGLMHFSEVWSGGPDTNFAMDLGGVIEYYPSRRTLIRVDLSDLMVRFDKRAYQTGVFTFEDLKNFLLGDVSGAVTPVARSAQTTHNFRLGVGFGFRF